MSGFDFLQLQASFVLIGWSYRCFLPSSSIRLSTPEPRLVHEDLFCNLSLDPI